MEMLANVSCAPLSWSTTGIESKAANESWSSLRIDQDLLRVGAVCTLAVPPCAHNHIAFLSRLAKEAAQWMSNKC